MMKKVFMYICFVLVMVIHCIIITSCNSNPKTNSDKNNPDSNKTILVMVAGIHSNSEIISMYSEEKINEIFSNFGEIRIVVADGNPEVALGENGKPLGTFDENYLKDSQEKKEKNVHMWEKRTLRKQTKSFIKEIENLEPDDPEVDILEALYESADILNSISTNNENTNKEIVIYDTGLCTSGTISFTDDNWANLLFRDGELEEENLHSLVESLKAENQIPDLSNIKVVWYGIGKTAEPQEKLEHSQIENLKKIWGEILNSAGAIPLDVQDKYSYFCPVESHGKTNYYQKVTVIPIQTEDSNNEDDITTFPDEKLSFKINSSDFVSEKTAIDILKPYAENMLHNPDKNILLVGTTADPERRGGSISLSEARASKVKECLVNLGVPETQIQIFGWGAKAPLYIEDEWQNGRFNENIAKKNRAVHIIPMDSQQAKELLQMKSE